MEASSSGSAHGPGSGGYGVHSNGTFPSGTGSTGPVRANGTLTGQFPFFTGGGDKLVGTAWLGPLVAFGAVVLLYS